jgi:dolichol-phosphate mannosyltransferase
MNYRCHRHGFRIAEVPILFVDRRVGKSKMGSHIVTEAMLVVLKLRVGELFGARGQSATPSSAAKYSKMP